MDKNKINFKEFKKGDIIFKEGDAGDCMYYISGLHNEEIGIYSGYGTDSQVLLAKITTGDFFGEMGLISGVARSATAVALTDAIVERIEEDNIKEYCKEKPYLMYSLLEKTSNNLRRLTNNYMKACDVVCDYVAAKESGAAISNELKDRIKALNANR